MTKEQIKKLLCKEHWSVQCQRAEDFIRLQPDDAIIDITLTGDYKYMFRKNRYEQAYAYDRIGFERKTYYVYIIAWKPI